jgi:hypothetical protein
MITTCTGFYQHSIHSAQPEHFSFPSSISISIRSRPAQPWKVRIYLLSGISASGDDGNTADLEDWKSPNQYL